MQPRRERPELQGWFAPGEQVQSESPGLTLADLTSVGCGGGGGAWGRGRAAWVKESEYMPLVFSREGGAQPGLVPGYLS